MNLQTLRGHALTASGSRLEHWLKALGFTAEPSTYRCDSESMILADFEHGSHGFHPVNFHGKPHRLHSFTKERAVEITDGHPVWIGEISGPEGHRRLVGTINPYSNHVVLFHQKITRDTADSSGPMQTLTCVH